jgi:hypothetical protein
MTEQELIEIKKRVEMATKGPWKSYIEGRDHSSGSDFIMTGVPENEDIWSKARGTDMELTGATKADQDFIANARQDIPKLLHEVERLKSELNNLKRRLKS